MKTMHTLLAALLLTATVTQAQPAASETQPDPLQTEPALNILLRHTDMVIPPASSCYGHYADVSQPTLGNLLATQLAYLYKGDNIIAGACLQEKCRIHITHAAGEDLFSTTIYFAVEQGTINPASLHCLMTP
ncbi:hypothetical protein CUZ56_01823 [Saezia sanguinis]|uniref:Uncharacterized protein n=1 Tax=Saezia sanguinis TaxID=1965230 RepID=A0A433SCR9_9BURK|nr:hypothetical protein [Saezia sanguinis]RUS66543.1 hypothetical protein CUZ56_01823 [Saezia sanguinis]